MVVTASGTLALRRRHTATGRDACTSVVRASLRYPVSCGALLKKCVPAAKGYFYFCHVIIR